MFKSLWLYILLLSSTLVNAAHLVGGEITYECLGNYDYEITLIVYRDCFSSGAPFDDTAVVTVFNSSNAVVANLLPTIFSQSQLPLTAPNNCTQLPNTVCTEKAIYKVTINLPPINGGYVISHQRCCRNSTILNIPNPGSWGNTYDVSIPSNDVACNSSPSFNATPPVVLCLNRPLNLDMSATDPDGDVLVYSLCEVKHGGGNSQSPLAPSQSRPKPDTSAAPPYQSVPFNPGYSYTNPITSSPVLTINPNTGFLTGTPTQVGQFVFAICVTEIRNGQVLSTVRRDFQFNVSGDCQGPESIAEDQIMNPNTLCVGRTISFKSISLNSSRWYWDFGDPTTDTDTSIMAHPTYTYADTGTYTVMLVAGSGSGVCKDTSYTTFKVYYPVTAQINYTGETCFESNLLNFDITGDFTAGASVQWDFGGLTNQGTTSNLRSPTGITYDQPGTYTITATVEDFECSATTTRTLFIYPRPVLKHYVEETHACAPVTIEFIDSSIAFGKSFHEWDFGDGTTSNDKSTTHTYTEPGLYTVQHYLKTLEGCIDSVYGSFTNIIEVFPSPESAVDVYPKQTTIYNPVVTIENKNSTTNTPTKTILPDGTVINNLESQILTFEDTGTFELTHIAFNAFGCTDTNIQYIVIDAPINLFIPSAFSPNGDGLNDILIMSATGITDFNLKVFNRWGTLVFESDDISYFWNGNIHNIQGNPVQAGVYTYRATLTTRKHRRNIVDHGTITVIH